MALVEKMALRLVTNCWRRTYIWKSSWSKLNRALLLIKRTLRARRWPWWRRLCRWRTRFLRWSRIRTWEWGQQRAVCRTRLIICRSHWHSSRTSMKTTSSCLRSHVTLKKILETLRPSSIKSKAIRKLATRLISMIQLIRCLRLSLLVSRQAQVISGSEVRHLTWLTLMLSQSTKRLRSSRLTNERYKVA